MTRAPTDSPCHNSTWSTRDCKQLNKMCLQLYQLLPPCGRFFLSFFLSLFTYLLPLLIVCYHGDEAEDKEDEKQDEGEDKNVMVEIRQMCSFLYFLKLRIKPMSTAYKTAATYHCATNTLGQPYIDILTI